MMRTYGVRSLALARGEIRNVDWLKQGSLVMLAAVFVALCAHIIIRLPYSPVPLTLQNFGVLMVGLMLGGKRGFAALLLYLAEGASELPVSLPSDREQSRNWSGRLADFSWLIQWWRW